jgi:hypothetical protein
MIGGSGALGAMKSVFRPLAVAGFGLSAPFALGQQWSLPEFCWSTWLAALVFSWACVLTAALQILAAGGANRGALEARFPFLRDWPAGTVSAVVGLAAIAAAVAAFWAYAFVFSFYGIFLSVFAEMEPARYFGRNGFINSDFFTPLSHLLHRHWPMAVGALVADAVLLVKGNPWRRFAVPFHSEALRLHLFVIALPFVAMGTWAMFGRDYHPAAILLLSLLFYFFPRGSSFASPNTSRMS